jgi:aryl-alcohol dehydrogenase-like predicted oxidoreductase
MTAEPLTAPASAGPGRASRTLCGRALSGVILGTAGLGSVLPDALVSSAARERAFRYLDGMVEVGCDAFDLAASYQIGGTERLFGHWLRSRRHRDRLFLIGKGGHPFPVVAPHRVTPRAVGDDLEATLRRLGTERLDLYLLHRDDPGAPLEALVEAFATFHRQGKIGAWGVSNWTHERVARIDALAREAGAPPVAASSPHFSLLEWAAVPWRGSVSLAGDTQREARSFHERTQLPVLAWSPLGRGFFSAHGGGQRASYESAANVARRERAERLARERGVTVAQIALAYVLCQPFPAFAIAATRTAENMKKNLEAAALRLSPGELRWLESGDEAQAQPR